MLLQTHRAFRFVFVDLRGHLQGQIWELSYAGISLLFLHNQRTQLFLLLLCQKWKQEMGENQVTTMKLLAEGRIFLGEKRNFPSISRVKIFRKFLLLTPKLLMRFFAHVGTIDTCYKKFLNFLNLAVISSFVRCY